jgi:hypothetical protein
VIAIMMRDGLCGNCEAKQKKKDRQGKIGMGEGASEEDADQSTVGSNSSGDLQFKIGTTPKKKEGSTLQDRMTSWFAPWKAPGSFKRDSMMNTSSSEGGSITSEGTSYMSPTKGKGGLHESNKKSGSHRRKNGGTEGSNEVDDVANSSDGEIAPEPWAPY